MVVHQHNIISASLLKILFYVDLGAGQHKACKQEAKRGDMTDKVRTRVQLSKFCSSDPELPVKQIKEAI